jgi:putative N-acetyltransferase (TIGR04045 family)
MPSELRLGGPTAAPARVPRSAHPVGHEITCRTARSASERADHLSIRHEVFVDEQAIFAGSDLDSRDDQDATIAVLGYSDGIAVGAVRLFVLEPAEGRWQGDRLAVLSAYRTHGIGAPLVRYAVATAAVHGGRTMTAHIQPANVTFFERLGWVREGESEIYAGLTHQPMRIDLPTRSEGLATVRRLEDGISARDR